MLLWPKCNSQKFIFWMNFWSISPNLYVDDILLGASNYKLSPEDIWGRLCFVLLACFLPVTAEALWLVGSWCCGAHRARQDLPRTTKSSKAMWRSKQFPLGNPVSWLPLVSSPQGRFVPLTSPQPLLTTPPPQWLINSGSLDSPGLCPWGTISSLPLCIPKLSLHLISSFCCAIRQLVGELGQVLKKSRVTRIRWDSKISPTMAVVDL